MNVIDWPWSLIHLLLGALLGMVLCASRFKPRRRFWFIGLTLLLLWEVFEIILRQLHLHEFMSRWPLLSFVAEPEAAANIIADIVIGSIGLWLGRLILQRRQSITKS